MSELIIPDKLTNDCENCQGLCCMAHRHNPRDGFPILNAKPPGVPCENLEIGQNKNTKLYGCNIYTALEEKGWTTCTRFNCYGAGQVVTGFFKELGVSWAQKQEDLDDKQWQIRILNFRYGYQALHYVFQWLSVIREDRGEEAYQRAKTAVASVSSNFCLAMEQTDKDLDPNYWAKVYFGGAIRNALQHPRTATQTEMEVLQEPEKVEVVVGTQGWLQNTISKALSKVLR